MFNKEEFKRMRLYIKYTQGEFAELLDQETDIPRMSQRKISRWESKDEYGGVPRDFELKSLYKWISKRFNHASATRITGINKDMQMENVDLDSSVSMIQRVRIRLQQKTIEYINQELECRDPTPLEIEILTLQSLIDEHKNN